MGIDILVPDCLLGLGYFYPKGRNMIKQDIICMAKQAGIATDWSFDFQIRLETFAALVASTEREACAKVCEEQMQGKSIWIEGARACSLAIRARGQA